MRFILLTLGILLAVPAYAAESNPVITINPDGSVIVVGDMPQPVTDVQAATPVPDPAPAAVEIVSPVEEFAATPVAAPVAVAALVPPPVPKVKPPVPVRQAKKKAPASAVAVAKPEPLTEEMQREAVSREDARRIALSVAPPSRGVGVYPADYNGLKVYQVVFKTEEGEQYVLVDRQNGAIVEEKKQGRKKR